MKASEQIWYVGQDTIAHPVCGVKHKAPGCEKIHEAPKDAIWVGPRGEFWGDFIIVLRQARKRHRQAVSKWQNHLNRLKAGPIAPEFAEWNQRQVEAFAKSKPVFEFKWPQEESDGEEIRTEGLQAQAG